MVGDRERLRRWRQSIAAGEVAAREEAIARAARRSPGENVEIAIDLSEFVSTYAASLERDEEVAPIALWRALGRTR